jgi:putative chitinase
MSIRGIGEQTTTAPFNDSNNQASSAKFVPSAQAINDVRAIKFVIEQFAAQTIFAAQPQQDNLQQEAQKLVEKHTSKGWFGSLWLDNDALGKELAATIGTRPELAKAVFERMGKTEIYTAQAMIDAASDEQLAQAAKLETGKQLLSQTKQAFADNIAHQKSWGELFASKEKIAADEQRIQKIDRATAEAAKTKQTTEIQTVQNTANNSAYRPVTEEQVRAIMQAKVPRAKKLEFEANLSDYTRRLNETMQRFGINTPAKQAAFLATAAHESTGMSEMTELPSNHASSRLKSKGRGIIQLTLDANYKAASKYFEWGKYSVKIDKNGKEQKVFTQWDLLDKPELAGQPDYTFPIAGWFWSDNKPTPESKTATPNSVIGNEPRADLQDFREASALVNSGGKNGRILSWGDRLLRYRDALDALGVETSPELRQNLETAIRQYKPDSVLSKGAPPFNANRR